MRTGSEKITSGTKDSMIKEAVAEDIADEIPSLVCHICQKITFCTPPSDEQIYFDYEEAVKAMLALIGKTSPRIDKWIRRRLKPLRENSPRPLYNNSWGVHVGLAATMMLMRQFAGLGVTQAYLGPLYRSLGLERHTFLYISGCYGTLSVNGQALCNKLLAAERHRVRALGELFLDFELVPS